MELTSSGQPRGTALCINAGSTTLKAAVIRDGAELGRRSIPVRSGDDIGAAVDEAIDLLVDNDLVLDAVGHRVVHGGRDFDQPTAVDDAVLAKLAALVALAPLHQPAALAGIDRARRRLPDVPNVACFDTAFHATLPEVARRLPLPSWCWDEGIRRYGFHGLSFEYVVDCLGDELGARAVIAHLGGGSSVVALAEGKPVDTTMGLTPGGGLVMATRSGDLDPGVVLALLSHHGLDVAGVTALLERESGLLGLSGRTGGYSELLALAPHDNRAALAVDTFSRSAAQHIAAMVPLLGGLDTLVFTGGIGANSADAWSRIAVQLAHLGVALDATANAEGRDVIGGSAGGPSIRALRTNEEAIVARHSLMIAMA